MSNVQHSSLTGSELHVPKVHKDAHVDGTDDIQDATSGQKGLATATQITKLDGVETAATADQTDAEIKTAIENAADLTIDNNLKFSASNIIEISSNNDVGGFSFNRTGYQGGTTKFRDIAVLDGKEATIIFVDGSSKETKYYGNITFNGAETVDGRDVSVDGTKLDGIETAADVTDATNVGTAGAVMETDYNANTVLMAATDNSPSPITIYGNSFVGRKATGSITYINKADALTIINVTEGADVTDTVLAGTPPAAANSTGTIGQIRSDASYIYVCVATNAWERAAIASW